MPDLIVIAGPNGAGKSTNAKEIIQGISSEKIESFDFDRLKWNYYFKDFDHDDREEMAHEKAYSDFIFLANQALENHKSFCYESNFFTDDAMVWPSKFKKEGFQIKLAFVALDSVESCIERVAKRVKTKGHNVPIEEIKERFSGSLKNVNQYYDSFDSFFLIDGSIETIRAFLLWENKKIISCTALPDVYKTLFPKITKKVTLFLKKD
jgi:predicted ABC-type ATPase